jgi:phosphoglycerate-specific signal transduction histidine kinase
MPENKMPEVEEKKPLIERYRSIKKKYLALKEKLENLPDDEEREAEMAALREKATLREAQQSVLTGFFAIDIATAALNAMNDPIQILDVSNEYRFEWAMRKKEKHV